MPIGDLLAEITGEPSPTLPQTMALPKRKVEEPLRRPEKKPTPPSANTSRPIAKPSVESMAKMKISDKKPTFTSPRAAFNNGQPTPPLADAPKAPPKKGSFAEIMARGKVAHSTMGQIGKIQHKKIEKAPSKREREEMRNQKSSHLQKNLAPGSKFQKIGRSSPAVGVKKMGKPAEPLPEKKIKKAAIATTGYAGTARPKPGGAKTSASSSSRGRDDRRSNSAPRYAYVSDEEEEAEEDDEEDYASDASSDMEAAAFEVDEEEELAARIARREDAEALAEENRLKREKEAKRKKLAAMAKKAKPERY